MRPHHARATKADLFLNLGALAFAGVLLFCTPPPPGSGGDPGGPVGDPNGDPTNSDPMSGDPMNGDPMSGDPMSGDPMSGDPMSGDPVTRQCGIISPAPGSTSLRRAPVRLAVNGGGAAITSVEWTSSLDGAAFASGDDDFVYLDLSTGAHQLTATITYGDASTCATAAVQATVIANAGVFDTGQTVCWDTTQAIDCGTATTFLGQDGMVGTVPLVLTDNGNGTVSMAGLTWQQQDDGSEHNWFEAAGVFDVTHNPDTIDVCGDLDFGGHMDWRLPTRRELLSIVHYGVASPAIDALFIGTVDNYWSSDVRADNEAYTWAVSFMSGSTVNYLEPHYPGVFVRCVRGGAPVGPYLIDNTDGTATDEASGLTWMATDAAPGAWSEALDYCNTLDFAGHDDWSLPDIRELESIVDLTSPSPMAPSPLSLQAARYASSTPAFGGWLIWSVSFADGNVVYSDMTTETNRVVCVRRP